MAFIIPPEYYGLSALGGLGRSAGTAFETFQGRKDDKKNKDFQEAWRSYQMMQASGASPQQLAEFLKSNPVLSQGIPEDFAPAVTSDQLVEDKTVVAFEAVKNGTATPAQQAIVNRATTGSAADPAAALELGNLEVQGARAQVIARARDLYGPEIASRIGSAFPEIEGAEIRHTPETLRSEIFSNLAGDPEALEAFGNVELFGTVGGLDAAQEAERLELDTGQARLENLQASTSVSQEQLRQLRENPEGKTLNQFLEAEVNNLVDKGVPATVAMRAVQGLPLSTENQALVDQARATMAGVKGATSDPSEFLTKITNGDIPSTFETEEQAMSHARLYGQEYGITLTPVEDDGGWFGGNTWTLKIGETGNPAVDSAAIQDKANVVAGQIDTISGILLRGEPGLTPDEAKTLATDAINTYGFEGAKAEAEKAVAIVQAGQESRSSPSERRVEEVTEEVPVEAAPKSNNERALAHAERKLREKSAELERFLGASKTPEQRRAREGSSKGKDLKDEVAHWRSRVNGIKGIV